MASSARKRSIRNIVLALILAGVTVVLIVTRLGPLLGQDDPDPPPQDEDTTVSETVPHAPATPPTQPNSAEEAETSPMTFEEFSEQYGLLREDFRARDSLTALLVGKRVVWEGHLRNVTRYTSSFYVTVWPSTSYGGTTASVTFDHAFEDVLYALSTEDWIRFEGVVKRAGGSIGIDGTAIERIE